jgi:hypothetical protein
MPSLNFLDLAKANSNDVIGGLIEENINASPELAVFDSEDLTTPGQLSYETLHRTGFPTVQFAGASEGFDPSKSEIKLVQHECFRFGGRVEAARHIADNWRRGGAAGYQAFEASGVVEAALKLIGRQTWYGVSYDGKGFPGAKAFTPKGGAFTYDATGTTATTASSIYFVKFGEAYCRLMAGRARNGNGLIDLPDFRIGDMTDANSKKMEAYISELSSYVGLQIAAAHSLVRICNVTADSGKGATDALLNEGIFLFPSGFRPDAIFMSKRSQKQLQTSRSLVSSLVSGKERVNTTMLAMKPTDFDGIPIISTDNILSTDAIE